MSAYDIAQPGQSRFAPTQSAPVQVNTQGLQGLGGAFADFFQNDLGGALRQLAQADHQHALAQQEQTNKDRQAQAVADATANRKPDEQLLQFAPYHDAFAQTLGKLDSAQLSNAWAQIVRDAPEDFDFEAASKDFLKQNVKPSGDPLYDGTVALGLRQTILQTEAQHADRAAATAFANNQHSYVQAVAAGTKSGRLTEDDINAFQTQGLALTKGNKAQAERLMIAGLTANVESDVEAVNVRIALQKSGWAEANPEAMAQVDQALAQKTSQAWSFEQRQVYNDLTIAVNDFITRTPVGQMDPDEAGAMRSQIFKTMRTMGGDQQAIGLLSQLNHRLSMEAKHKAKVNWFQQVRESGGIHTDATASGASAKDYRIAQYAGWTNEAQANPELAATVTESGHIRPLGSDGAANAFAYMTANQGLTRATIGEIPSEFKEQFDAAVNGTDTALQARAIRTAMRSAELRGDPGAVTSLFTSDEAKHKALVIAEAAAIGEDIPTLLRQYKENPATFEAVTKVSKGEAKWNTLPGLSGLKESDAQAHIAKSMSRSLSKAFGLDGWLSSETVIAGWDSRAANELHRHAMLAASAEYAMNPNKTPDWNAAYDRAVTVARQKLNVLPTGNGTFQVVHNTQQTQDGTGLNAQRPFKTTVGGAQVYAMGIVRDAEDKPVSTLDTAREDFKRIQEITPNILGVNVLDSKKLGLAVADPTFAKQGLYRVVHAGNPVTVELGGKLDVLTKPTGLVDTLTSVFTSNPPKPIDIPKDPQEAVKLLNETYKGTGVHWVAPDDRAGVTAGAPYLQMYYGGRIDKDLDWFNGPNQATRKAKFARGSSGGELPVPNVRGSKL